MAESDSSILPIAMRMVGDAIRLDSQNCKKEAYCQYLSCCVYISQTLKDVAWNQRPDLRQAYNKDIAKLFKLIQQCQDRALTIVSEEGTNPTESPSGSPIFPRSQLSHTSTTSQHNAYKTSDSSSPSREIGRPPQGHSRSLLHFPSPPSPSASLGHLNSSSLMRPSCKGSYHQDSSSIGHHLRAAKLNTSNTDKTLTSIRRMSENYAIAKAREEAIRKKVWERQQRLQEEANRRFASAVAASKQEQEQRILYTKILEYEQEMVWPRQLREKLKQMPENTALINNIINKIFSSKDHPLRQFLLQYQYHVYKKLLPLLKDVNFPDGKHLQKSTIDNTPHEGKDSMSERAKDDSSEVLNIKKQNVELGSECASPDRRNSCENIKDTSEIVKNTEESNEFKDNTEVPIYCGSIIPNIDANVNLNDNSNTNANVEEAKSFNDDTEDLKDENYITTDGDDTILSENGCSKLSGNSGVDKKDNDCCSYSRESNIETGICTDEVSLVVRCIIEDILDAVLKNGSKSIPKTNEFKEPTDTQRSDEDDACDEHNVISNKKEIENIGSNDPQISSNESDPQKNKIFLRIKSFDESEFESLEDDMFDSGSSENEEEIEENSHPVRDTNSEISDTTSERLEHNRSTIAYNETLSSIESTKEESNTVVNQSINTSREQNEPTISPEEDLELTRKQLNDIFVDMRFFLEKLKGFIILAYEELATPVGHDQCYAAVEFPFFQPLWPLLLGVLRRLNFDKELSLGCVMTKHIRDPPAAMGVVDRLCLSDQSSLPGSQYPYQAAVEQLHRVVTSYCPLEKVDILVHVLRSICHCVEDYWESKGKPRHCPETSIGCDDLLPVLCYVIVRSGMAQLVSECSAMEEFIPEGYLMGEEGYCLTTLQTALAYLVAQDQDL